MFKKSITPLSLTLYIVSGLTAALAAIILVSSLGFRTGIEASLMILRAGLNPIANAMLDMLIQGIQNIGVVFGITVFIISFLLFAGGRQATNSKQLSNRIVDLESRIAALEGVSEGS